MIRITTLAPPAEPELAWDTVIGDDFLGDFAIAGRDEGDNAGGLSARRALATAVILSLFTDRAVEEHELRTGDQQRGWPGDALTLRPGEALAPLGSKLWLLRRRAMQEDEAVRLAGIWAREALAWLVEDKVATAVDVSAVRSATNPSRLDLAVTITGPGGAPFAARWEIHWRAS